jgi:hypothetical protein
MSSRALKSAPASERTTVSVRSGRIRADSVPQAESRKRSLKFASANSTSRNWVASSGEIASSRAAADRRPVRMIWRT